eukprot:g3539.t1
MSRSDEPPPEIVFGTMSVPLGGGGRAEGEDEGTDDAVARPFMAVRSSGGGKTGSAFGSFSQPTEILVQDLPCRPRNWADTRDVAASRQAEKKRENIRNDAIVKEHKICERVPVPKLLRKKMKAPELLLDQTNGNLAPEDDERLFCTAEILFEAAAALGDGAAANFIDSGSVALKIFKHEWKLTVNKMLTLSAASTCNYPAHRMRMAHHLWTTKWAGATGARGMTFLTPISEGDEDAAQMSTQKKDRGTANELDEDSGQHAEDGEDGLGLDYGDMAFAAELEFHRLQPLPEEQELHDMNVDHAPPDQAGVMEIDTADAEIEMGPGMGDGMEEALPSRTKMRMKRKKAARENKEEDEEALEVCRACEFYKQKAAGTANRKRCGLKHLYSGTCEYRSHAEACAQRGPPGAGAGGDADASGEASPGAAAPTVDEHGRPLDAEGFLMVADPDGLDLDGKTTGKSHVVLLSRTIRIRQTTPLNPYGLVTDTSQHIQFYEENGALIGMSGSLTDFESEQLFVAEELLRIGYNVGDAGCVFGNDPNEDEVKKMGRYEARIADKRLQLFKVISGLREARAFLRQKEAMRNLEADKKRAATREEELKLRASKAEKNAADSRPCLVCQKRLPNDHDVEKEVRCRKCKNRGVCLECWDDRAPEVSRFFSDPTRPKLCFSCVQAQAGEEMELYCETVQSVSGQLNFSDAELIAREHDWVYKLAEQRGAKPSVVLRAYDLIRYPRLARFMKKADDSSFRDLSAAASALEKTKRQMIQSTMEKKVVASTYFRMGFKTLLGTTKKGAIDSNAQGASLESAEAFFRELKDGYSRIASKDCSDAQPYRVAVWLCDEALFLLKVTRDDYLGRSHAALSELSNTDRMGLEQMARCAVYSVLREDRKVLKKGSSLTKSDRLLYQAVYVNKVRKLEMKAVQQVLVSGQGVESNSALKQLEKRLSSVQSKTDRLESAAGGRGSMGGGDPSNPLAGNMKDWKCDSVSRLPQYIEMRSQIGQLSAAGKTRGERLGWCNSSIRNDSKLTMYVLDAYYGQFTPSCRNCWGGATEAGEPPKHSYGMCRQLGNVFHLICPHCRRSHDEWPDACLSAPKNSNDDGGNGGPGGGNGGKRGNKGGGGRPGNNNKRNNNRSSQGGGSVRKDNDKRDGWQTKTSLFGQSAQLAILWNCALSSMTTGSERVRWDRRSRFCVSLRKAAVCERYCVHCRQFHKYKGCWKSPTLFAWTKADQGN